MFQHVVDRVVIVYQHNFLESSGLQSKESEDIHKTLTSLTHTHRLRRSINIEKSNDRSPNKDNHTDNS